MTAFKLATARELAEAGSISSAMIVGQPGGWGVRLRVGQSEGALSGKDGRPRLFSKIDTAAATMRDLGLTQLVIDLAGYAADDARPRRPDRSVALKRTHAAAAHDTWFRQQVQGTLDRISAGQTGFQDHDELFDALEASVGPALAAAK